jgi:hypothetical protein
MKSTIGDHDRARGFESTEKTINADGLGQRNIVEEYRLKIMAKLGKKVGSSATAETFNFNVSQY